MIDLRVGDCMTVFASEPDESFDAFVMDPPAGIAFMNRSWDRPEALASSHIDAAFAAYLRTLDRETRGEELWVHAWRERFAVMRAKMKPGAYALVWAMPRTADWTMRALRRAGLRIIDVIVHVFGQGWSKNGDVAKQAAKQGLEGVEAGQAAALKPAAEHWILVQRPIEDRLTIAGNVAKWRTGALQIDATRVARGAEGGSWPTNFIMSHSVQCEERGTRQVRGAVNGGMSQTCGGRTHGMLGSRMGHDFAADDGTETVQDFDCLAACDCGASVLAPAGGAAPRCACGQAMWWACPVAEMDAQSGYDACRPGRPRSAAAGRGWGQTKTGAEYTDDGGASRFFPRFTYQAKAGSSERDAGCDELYWRRNQRNPFGFDRVTREEWAQLSAASTLDTDVSGASAMGRKIEVRGINVGARGNVHPTVKRISLMEWLCALVCPPDGRLGDMTLGSGGTAIAWYRICERAGIEPRFLGCDLCPEAIEIATARLAWWRAVRLDVKPTKRSDTTSVPPAQGSLF